MRIPEIVSFEGVSKQFGQTLALRDVGFSVAAKEIVVIIGANGAGKSSLLGSAVGLVRPDSGSIKLFGDTVQSYFKAKRRKHQARLGFASAKPMFYSHLSLRENLTLFAALDGLPDTATQVDSVSERFDLLEFQQKRISECSQGMLRRAVLARALLGGPELLLLDEPFLGLDIWGRRQLLQVLGETRDRAGGSVLLATHDEDVIRQIADRVVVLKRGKLVAVLSKQEAAAIVLAEQLQ